MIRNEKVAADKGQRSIGSDDVGIDHAFQDRRILPVDCSTASVINARSSATRSRHQPRWSGYANGYKPKRIDTPAGSVTVQVPKTAGHDAEPFYPQSLERGRRSVRAVMLAVAEMYIKGVSALMSFSS